MMLLAWKIDRRLGWAFTVFTALIFVGSIWLGWHYAADGVAGLLLAATFWLAAGRMATAWHRFLARRRAGRSIANAIPFEA
jgi:drug/metabolite transporter (DMT)-like permease